MIQLRSLYKYYLFEQILYFLNCICSISNLSILNIYKMIEMIYLHGKQYILLSIKYISLAICKISFFLCSFVHATLGFQRIKIHRL